MPGALAGSLRYKGKCDDCLRQLNDRQWQEMLREIRVTAREYKEDYRQYMKAAYGSEYEISNNSDGKSETSSERKIVWFLLKKATI